MATRLLINSTPYENRIALVEKNTLLEIHLERPAAKGLVGNIYRGRVVRVLPGMQAAFVDIGLERTGFLYVDDVHIEHNEIDRRATKQYQGCNVRPLAGSPDGEAIARYDAHPSIKDLLREGQEILVQISKEPIGTKGARLTCHITLPCRNLVFMPLTDHIGISRKIIDEDIRQRLRETIEQLRPEGTGFIVRTVAENISNEELEADMEFLLVLWDEITAVSSRVKVPSLVHRDLDMVLRSVRDLFTEDVEELIIDSQPVYERLSSFVQTFAPHLIGKITYYDKSTPLFDAYGIEGDINRAIDRKVWLRSGGYIIIETTEALSVIDVNTGSYVGKNDLAETIFKTNMEAVREIAYQLRLRNIGGIIIIDFIDMDSEAHREQLYITFQEAMQSDKNRVNILKLSEFGLVQMTRKRSCQSLDQMICEPCFYCGGEGKIKSRRSVCYEIFRKISREEKTIGGYNVTIKVHPQVADMLLTEETEHVERLEQESGKRFTILPVPDMHRKRYEIIWNE